MVGPGERQGRPPPATVARVKIWIPEILKSCGLQSQEAYQVSRISVFRGGWRRETLHRTPVVDPSRQGRRRGIWAGQQNAPLPTSATDSRPPPACASYLPRGHRTRHRRRLGSKLGSHRRSFLSKVPSSGRPTSTSKETFGETVDLGDCIFGYGGSRPNSDL